MNKQLHMDKSPFITESKLHGRLVMAWLGGFLWFIADKTQPGQVLPPGAWTVLLACVLEISIIAALFAARERRPKEYRYFLYFFVFLLIGDAAHVFLYYIFHVTEKNTTTFLLNTLPYTLAYCFGCVGYFKHLRKKLSVINWFSFIWLPILLIAPSMLEILVPLTLDQHKAGGWEFASILNGFQSVALFFWATTTLILSVDKVFMLAGLAGVVSQLSNWGSTSMYLLNEKKLLFDEYELLWLIAIITFWYAFIVVGKRDPDTNSLATDEVSRRSLVSQQRMAIIGTISASLLVTVLFFDRSVWSYRVVLFGVAIGCYISILAGEFLSQQIVQYAMLFGNTVNLAEHQGDAGVEHQDIPIELWQIYRLTFHDDILQRRLKSAVNEKMSDFASQVAHDIRSPLAALDSAVGDVSQLPEDKRLLIRGAASRIRDIANSLLRTQRAHAGESIPENLAATSSELLSSMIDPVVSEKRLQFRSQARVEIELRLDASSYGLFAAVQPVEFKRLVSNLVNNAVEAFGESSGAVSVDLSSRDGHAIVSVQDNGKGIPPEVLARLGQRGETHGKAGGSGLGLHHARTSAESWGGRLELASEVGKGTTATLVLPLAPAPDWFVPEIRLTPGKAVVILDDDASIHQVWQGRLDILKAAAQGVEIVHVSSPVEIRGWVKANEAKAEQALYLFDYELLGHRDTGLSLAEELGLGARVVLVTSRSEEPEVMAGCWRLKARLIPKGLAGSVPMRVEAVVPMETSEGKRFDAVLIDNDPLTRMVWENDAADRGKLLKTFSTVEDFFNAVDGIDRATPVYVDFNLGEGVKGDEETRRIHGIGFGEVYLATGHEPERFAQLTHIRGVIGKEPPWGEI